MQRTIKIFITLTLAFISLAPLAHSGRTNSSGCHNETKTGGYHCHGNRAADDEKQITPSTSERVPASAIDSSSSDKPMNSQQCCKVCNKGKACGNSCINRSYTCTKAPGCACDG